MPFKVGDKVVYPHHGAAVIEGTETITMPAPASAFRSESLTPMAYSLFFAPAARLHPHPEAVRALSACL